MTIGQILKNLRAEKNISQVEFSERAGIPLPTVKAIEQNKRNPGLRLSSKICNYFGITLASLYKDTANIIPGATAVDEPLMIKWESLLSPGITKGDGMLHALTINNNEMEPEFKKGEVIHVQIGEKPNDGNFVVAVGGGNIVFRLYKKYGNQVVLQPLNKSFPEIHVTNKNPYKIVAVVKKAMSVREY